MRRVISIVIDKLYAIQLKRKHVYVGLNVRISKDSKVSGYNKFGHKSKFIKSDIGLCSYIANECNFVRTKIGNFCSIGPRVNIIAGQHPINEMVSTSPVFYNSRVFEGVGIPPLTTVQFKEFKYVSGSEEFLVEIGNDVWIGSDVKILEGCTVGDGAIIGAGALVTKNIPPYAIVVGTPARITRYRFSEDIIERLLISEWWNNDIDAILKNRDQFHDVKSFLNNAVQM